MERRRLVRQAPRRGVGGGRSAEEYPGTGMGLAIVKKIVESNGGSVPVEATTGEGAIFIVPLPAGEVA